MNVLYKVGKWLRGVFGGKMGGMADKKKASSHKRVTAVLRSSESGRFVQGVSNKDLIKHLKESAKRKGVIKLDENQDNRL